ncbi:LA2681 family HEPN domain-containing protein [Methylobacter sp. Wu8]|uniref:LA2681 family HEPN domain-containing protein n=1 Tax=Methylobacter sp. Wu8 TaxID=3118457 RepID=UPI002F2D445A
MQEKLHHLASEIDQALDNGDIKKLQDALNKIEELSTKEITGLYAAQLYFFAANCYAGIRQANGNADSWAWSSPNVEKEIYCLRLSLSECYLIPFEQDQSDLRFRVGTNLANALNHVGRFAEAIEIWDEVLNQHPRFAMAISNRGHCLCWYARHLYDTGHQPIFLHEAYKSIQIALTLGVEEHAVSEILEWLEYLGSLGNWDAFSFEPESGSRGRSKLEKKYRTWCLERRLFLNPLNDLGAVDIAANDALTFPSIVVSNDEVSSAPPEVYGIYNQLKQEYVSARYILFEAIEESSKGIHFSDKRVKLYNTLDYRYSRLWVEKLKMAFLAAYAIFDKIAYLINEYWNLNLPIKKISFDTVWFERANKEKGLAAIFANSENWPLRGLYWVSKDLYYKADSSQPMEPDARHLNYIRNHITHKYLKVHDHILCDTSNWRDKEGHELSYPISDRELKQQAIKLLKLVRNALIYVSLAAHSNECKAREKIGEGLIGEMQLFEIGDRYRL